MKSKIHVFLFFFALSFSMWQCSNSSNDSSPTPDAPSPTIASFTPTTGNAGTSVTITGTNFSTTLAENIVRFNGTTATVTSATATSITTTVPANASTGKITVEVAGKIATSASDFNVFTIRNYTTVSTLAGNGTGNSVDGTGTNASFNNPFGLVKDSQGNFFVTDNGGNVIRKVTPAGVVTTIAGTAGQLGHTDGTGAAARFSSIAGICIDAADNLYVVEALGNRVRKITPAGVVTTLAGSTSGASGNVDATGTEARFSSPFNIAIDAQNNLYVTDVNNNKIRKVTPAGVVTTLASSVSSRWLCFNAQGVLYHASNTGINTINTSTGATTLIVGSNNVNDFGFTEGTGTAARFNNIRGISADSQGNIYVSDQDNSRIRKVSPQGVVSTLTGNGTSISADGTLAQATFRGLMGIFVDRAGDNAIYVLEGIGSHRFRKID